MFNQAVYDVLRHLPKYDLSKYDDPTSLVQEAVRSSGVGNPDDFHGHFVKSGEGLPDERPHGLTDREIYFLKQDGSMEYHFIKGDPVAGVFIDKKDTIDECCTCGISCCVIEKP